jgi:Tol biopolymer transport system component
MGNTAMVSPAPASPAIAFTLGGGGIYAIRPDGSGRVRLTAGRTDPDVGTGDADPAWSPDGATLAFVRTIRLGFEEFHSQVYLLGPGQGASRPLTAGVDGVSVSGPAWSPDGERIAHVRDTDSETAIVVAEVDGGGEQVLRREPYDIEGDRNHLWQPAWSPDAARIAYTLSRLDRRSHFRTSLHTMNTAGGDVRLLAREASDAAWSPDGRRIAFVSVRDRNGATCYDQCNYHGELYVMDADGTDPVRLTRNRGDDRSPSWSPDGRRTPSPATATTRMAAPRRSTRSAPTAPVSPGLRTAHPEALIRRGATHRAQAPILAAAAPCADDHSCRSNCRR